MQVSGEYKEVLEKFVKAHKNFISSLDGELRERAEEVFGLNEELNYESAFDYFNEGLKFGLLLGMEVNGKT